MKHEYLVFDSVKVAPILSARTGIDVKIVLAVLEAETVYMGEIGLLEEVER